MTTEEGNKLPIGVIPLWLSREQRYIEVKAAIERYEEASLPFPKEWASELKTLEYQIRAHNANGLDQISNGELIDSFTMDEILYHEEFHQLTISRGLPMSNSPDYWEVIFKSEVRTENGWQMFNGGVAASQYYCFYKLKTNINN